MKNLRRSWIIATSVVLAIVLLTIGYCNRTGKSQNGATLIPQDAAIVVALDIPQMMGKVNFEILNQSQRLQASLTDFTLQNPLFAEIMREPTQAGINYRQPVFAAYLRNPNRPEEDFTAIIIKLSDVKDFERTINRATFQEKKINKGFYSLQIDQLTTVGWNGRFAILGSSDLAFDLDAMLGRFFNVGSENALLNEPSFRQAMEQKGDFLFWVSAGGFMADEKILNRFGLKGLPAEIVSGNYVIGSLDFSKGKMSGLAKFILRPEVGSRFDYFFDKDFDADFSTYIPDAGRKGTFMCSLNLPGIYRYSLSDAEVREGLEGWLAENGVRINDLLHLFGGDLLLVNYQQEGAAKTASLLATNIFRPELLQQYLDLLVKADLIRPVSEGLYATKLRRSPIDSTQASAYSNSLSYHLIVQKDKIFFSDDGPLIDAISKGGYAPGLRMKENAKALMAGNFLHGQVDLASLRSVNGGQMDEFETLTFELNKKQLDFQVTLKDKSASALETVLQGGIH